jgi:type II secretory pathway pseudopilin PulG
MRMTRRLRGFSLIEAVVAVAVLALSCLAVTAVLHGSLNAEAGIAARRGAVEALYAESSRLRALPFFRQSAGPGQGPPSLASEVFPHAQSWLDTDDASYDTAAGAFITRGVAGGLRLTRTARFERPSTGGLEPLPAADVQGWAVWSVARPPATVLSVHLEADGPHGLVISQDLVVCALRPGSRSACTARGGHARAG